jgi:hypothetical protein
MNKPDQAQARPNRAFWSDKNFNVPSGKQSVSVITPNPTPLPLRCFV